MNRYDRKFWGYWVQAAVLSTALVFAACTSSDDDCDGCGTESTDPVGTDDVDPQGCIESGSDICICKVTGRLVDEDGEPLVGAVQLCPLAADYPSTAFYTCNNVSSDADGVFEYRMVSSNECRGYAEEAEAIFDIRLDTTGFVKYSALYDPTQAEIDDDYGYDVGDMVLYAEPTGGVPYNDATGSVVTFDDGALTLVAGAADDRGFPDGTPVSVMEFAVDGSQSLPFLPDGLTLDALYYVTPYFAKHFDPAIEVTIDAPAGWGAGETGKLYQLGDIGDASLYCATTGDSSSVEQGHFIYCDDLEEASGGISFTINTPSWFGIAKD